MPEYEWLTKGKRAVRIRSYVDGKLTNDKVEQRMVYPPKKGVCDGIHPTINWMGGRRNVVPQPDGAYLMEFHIRSLKKFDPKKLFAR